MKTLKAFLTEKTRRKIVADSSSKSIVRDGGSAHYQVKNEEECGYCYVIQDFSIGSKRKGTEGRCLGMLPPPNHTSDKYEPIEYADIFFE